MLATTPRESKIQTRWKRARGGSSRGGGTGGGTSAGGIWRGVLLGALAALGWRAVAALGWAGGLESALLDTFFQVRRSRFPHPSLVLVAVDDATVARARTFPLPRRWHARVVDSLARSQVKTIGFDVLFSDASASPQDDRALEQACARAGNVVQAAAFWVPAVRNPEVASSIPASALPAPSRFHVSEDPKARARCAQGVWATIPTKSLENSAVALGHLNAYPEPDGVQRRVPPLIRYREGVYPSLAVASAAHFLGLEPRDIVASADEVRVGRGEDQRVVRVDRSGEAWINWSGGYRSLPTFSYLEVLEGRVPPEVLRGKIVLVGVTAAGSYDQRATPLASVQPGLEIHAGALNDILQNRSLSPPPPALVEVSTLLLPIALGALVAFLGGRAALGAGMFLIGLVLLGSVWAFAARDFLWPVATPIAAMATALALVGASNYRRAAEASWRAGLAVDTLARGGSLLSSATRLSQTARGEVAGQSKDVLLDAEPARRELARVAAGTLAQALGSPLVLWVREGAQPLSEPLSEPLLASAPEDQGAVGDSLKTESARLLLRDFAREIAALERPEPLLIFARAPHHTNPNTNRNTHGESQVQALREVLGGSSRRLAPRLGPQVLVAPVSRGSSRAGVLLAFTSPHAAWGEREVGLARAVVEQAILALENLEYTHALAGRVQAADRELQRAYDLVSEQSMKLSAAIEGIADALLVVDERGCAVFVNAAARAVLRDACPEPGQSVPQVLGDNGLAQMARAFDILPANQHRTLLITEVEVTEVEVAPPSVVRNAVHDERVDERVEGEETRDREGAAQVLAWQFVPLGGVAGRAPGAMLIVSDVSVRRELDKMKTDFVSFVAHELRTPLTTILGYASLLQSMGEKMEGAQREQMSGVIIQHCKRLNRMISEMLDTSCLDAGGSLSLRLEAVNLDDLCERMVEEHRRAHASVPNLTLDFEASHRPLVCALDADRVEQIISNLLSNAVKYSPEGGRVLLQVLGQVLGGDRVVIRVSDQGMGMTPEQVSQLFQKFYRTSDAQARGIKGTGLGLFLVKQLVEAHGGHIEVESESGRGTAFSVSLPASTEPSRREWKLGQG